MAWRHGASAGVRGVHWACVLGALAVVGCGGSDGAGNGAGGADAAAAGGSVTPGADAGGGTGAAGGSTGGASGGTTGGAVGGAAAPDAGPAPVDAAAPGPDAAPGSAIGGECVAPEDCESGFCLDSTYAQAVAMDDTVMIPGGYCTDLTCQASEACGEGASCIDLQASGLDVPFKACFRDCDPAAEGACRADQSCYCDPDGKITDVEGMGGHCLCLPEVLVGLLSGG